MPMVLNDCTIEEQRTVFRFVWGKILESKKIPKEMLRVNGKKCSSSKAVYKWVQKFSQGRSKIVDEDRSNHTVLIATKSTEQKVEELIRAD
ncbi:uncharacterized protein TNIN_10711 [Trichonephila inaurata madagascariensis]|uniref:Uncharacterized protein n=1 Tax=Trichonephila inaurata madagascariensis TaxID=2747483 RepID=A0A8X6IP49_9ARAC|nr:uncharacterized protein TNIN_10711 [Trichonephila inaurata madagascariensis]